MRPHHTDARLLIEDGGAALVCINAQHEQKGACAHSSLQLAERTTAKMRLCLEWGRAARLPIVHVLTAPESGRRTTSALRTIPGLRPTSSEPVFIKTGPSLFDSEELKQSRILEDRRTLILIGFTLGSDCLATTFDAARAGKAVILIEDAIASFDLPPYSGAEARGVLLALAAQRALVTSSRELIHRHTHWSVGGTHGERSA